MCATFTRLATILFLLLALGGSTLSCAAYTYVQAGVESNFLLEENRVLFAQAEGSLTALSLESGKVLFRNKTRDFSGTFQRIPQGILLFTSQTIALLKSTDFSTVWETSSHYEPCIAGDTLVSFDGSNQVQCRSLADGKLRWSYELAAVSTIVAESGKVLLHRDAAHDESKFPMVVLLELNDGKLLLRRIATNRVSWAETFFDGTNIFVLNGSYTTNRSTYKPERMAVWNLSGEETHSLPIPKSLHPAIRKGEIFELEEKIFWKSRVYADRESIPFEGLGKPVSTAGKTNGPSWTFETAHELNSSVTLMERVMYVAGRTNDGSAFALQVELRAPTNRWTGVLSYLLDRGRITAVGLAKGIILIGTDLGHVECVQADTGESLWLYVFPTLHRMVSYSPHDPPPMMAEAAAVFRNENSFVPTTGLQIVGRRASKPRIIFDPNPIDDYQALSLHLTLAWCGGAIPLVILLLLHALPWTRKWEPASLGSIGAWLTLLVFAGYVYYGKVSAASSLTLKIALAAGFAAGLWNAVKCYRLGQWLEGTILAVLFSAVALFIAQALL